MTDAPRLSPADELNKLVTHAPLFKGVRSRSLKAKLEDAVRRMSGLGEDAESEYQRALAALRQAGGEAIDALGQEFEALAADQYVNRWAVVQLLTDLADPYALGALDRIIASPLPEERSKDPHGSTAARELVVRTTAVEAVARLAAGGSAEARAALLKYVRHPVRSVKIAAALAYVAQGGRRARKELQGRMAKSDRWILEIRRMHPRETPLLEGHRFLPPKSPPEAVTAPRPITGGQAATGKTESGAPRARFEGTAVPPPSGSRSKPDTPPAGPTRRKNKKTRG
jgi:hypothetical protein